MQPNSQSIDCRKTTAWFPLASVSWFLSPHMLEGTDSVQPLSSMLDTLPLPTMVKATLSWYSLLSEENIILPSASSNAMGRPSAACRTTGTDSVSSASMLNCSGQVASQMIPDAVKAKGRIPSPFVGVIDVRDMLPKPASGMGSVPSLNWRFSGCITGKERVHGH